MPFRARRGSDISLLLNAEVCLADQRSKGSRVKMGMGKKSPRSWPHPTHSEVCLSPGHPFSHLSAAPAPSAVMQGVGENHTGWLLVTHEPQSAGMLCGQCSREDCISHKRPHIISLVSEYLRQAREWRGNV